MHSIQPLQGRLPGPTIWYIFPPIGGPGLGRYWRAYHLARWWQSFGAKPTLIGPGYHHYFQRSEALSGAHHLGGVNYQFVPVAPYGEKPAARVRAILNFAFGLVFDRDLADLAA